MALTGIDLLEALDELDDLLLRRETAEALDLLDLLEEIDAVMIRLGYDTAAVEPDPDTTIPAVVTEFLAGAHDGLASAEFIDVLESLDQYVGNFITLDQIIEGADRWWTATGAAEAA